MVAVLLLGQGCVGAPVMITPTPTVTNTPTLTPTPTTVWFPPTHTYTPFPTPDASPTPDVNPEYGLLILTDQFEEERMWMIGRFSGGVVSLGKRELTLAVSSERGYLSSLRRQTNLADFYAEITASPSLCRGEDEYGILVRASESSFYRFSLSCDGRARLDRFASGAASSPQTWVMSAAIPPGAPSESRLAVHAVGKEMRFYVNGHFLFSVRDGLLPEGSIGVFARASGDTPITVNFSNLEVYEASS